MKKKLDFITNSSSTSFIAWGITMSGEELKKECGKELFKIHKQKQEKEKHGNALKQGAFMVIPSDEDKNKLAIEYDEFLEDDEFIWTCESIFEDVGLDVRQMPYEDEVMIGKCPFSIKPDQTLNEFKQEICDKFKQAGVDMKPDKLGQIEECWMDN